MVNKKICASCLDFSIDNIEKSDDENNKPSWLSKINYVRNFINKQDNFKLRIPNNYNLIINLNIGKKHYGKKILYWSSEEKKTNSPIVLDAKKAYGNFNNSGIVNVQNTGEILIKIRCPQIYRTTSKGQNYEESFYRHLHFVISNKDNNKWGKQIYTKIVICKHNIKQIEKYIIDGLHILINTLPSNYYAKDHIPNSFNLYYKDIKKMNTDNLFDWFNDVCRLHYPKLYKYIKDDKINIYEIPIITYCADDKCNASELATKELLQKGFVNINEYPGGIREYRKYYIND
jgi:hypothetical protein